MAREDNMNIDYEKLRKALVTKEFATGLMTGTHGDFANCVNAYNATPEQLLSIARRYNVRLEKYINN